MVFYIISDIKHQLGDKLSPEMGINWFIQHQLAIRLLDDGLMALFETSLKISSIEIDQETGTPGQFYIASVGPVRTAFRWCRDIAEISNLFSAIYEYQ